MPALSLDTSRAAGQAALNEALCVDAFMWISGIVELPAAPSKSHTAIVQHFLDSIETGVQLHKLLAKLENRDSPIVNFHANAQPASFQARDNVASFVELCMSRFGLPRADVFESDDLVLRKNPKAVALTIIQLSRAAQAKHSIAPSESVQLEQEIQQQKKEDRETPAEEQEEEVQRELQANTDEESKEEAGQQVAAPAKASGDDSHFVESTALDVAISQFMASHALKLRVVKVDIRNKKKKRNADRKAEYLIGKSNERVHVRMLHGLLVAMKGTEWVSFDSYIEAAAH
jgi:hypothetical protein